MAITSTSTITNPLIPTFKLTTLTNGNMLVYSTAEQAFINTGLSGSLIADYTIVKNHLSASASGGAPGQFLTIGLDGQLKWSPLTNTDPTTILFGDLFDVDTTNADPNFTIVYDGVEWVAVPYELDVLADVNVTAPLSGQYLAYDGVSWVNKNIQLNDIDAVDITGANVYDILSWNGSQWIPAPLASLSILNLNDLDDVDTSGVAINDTIIWDGASWVPSAIAGNGFSVEDLSNTTITTPITNDVLTWDGSIWVNAKVDYADITNTPDLSVYPFSYSLSTIAYTGNYSDIINPPVLFDGAYASLTGTPATFTPSVHTHVVSDITDIGTLNIPVNLDDLADVDTVTIPPVTGDLLHWNNTQWEPITPVVPSLSTLSDTTITSPVAGEFLKYNGVWINSAITASDVSGLSTVATTGDYVDLINAPVLATVATSGDYVDLINAPLLTTVATSGDYADLINVPLDFTPSAHVHVLTDISDVSIINVLADNQVLVYNTGLAVWENRQLAITDLAIVDGVDGDSIIWDFNTSEWIAGRVSLDAASDVTITTPVTGQFLKWDTTEWVNADITYSDITGVLTVPSHTHVAADITDFTAEVDARNTQFVFASLADVTAPTDGYLFWNTSTVQFQASIPVTDVTGLATVATSGDYNDLINVPVDFAPAIHTHNFSDISNSDAPLGNGFFRWDNAGTQINFTTTIPASDVSGLAVVATSGDYADLAGLQDALDLKFNADGTTLANLVITYSQISDQPTIPVNNDFSLVDLNDTDNAIPGVRASQFLRWDVSGNVVEYVTLSNSDFIGVSSLPALNITYSQIIDPPTIPVNADFSLADLNDTDGISTPTARKNKYLRWNTAGTAVEYSVINSADVSNLSVVAVTGLLSDLSDINFGIPNDGDVLTYVSLSNTWTSTSIVLPTSSFAGLTDTGTPALGYLRWSGLGVVYDSTIPTTAVSGLSLVATTGMYDDLINVFDRKYTSLTNIPALFTPTAHTHTVSQITDLSVSVAMENLTDVNIDVSLLRDGDILSWDDTNNEWAAIRNNSITDLLDVNDDAAETRGSKFLRWSTDGSAVVFTSTIPFSSVTGSALVATTGLLEDLVGVEIHTTLSSGDVLSYDGVIWKNLSLAALNDTFTSLGALTDVTVSGVVDGDVLTYAAGEWINATPIGAVTQSLIESVSTLAYVQATLDDKIAIVGPAGISLATSAGTITLEGQTWPFTDGLAGYILTTDGAGVLSWTAPSVSGATTLLGLTDTPSSYVGQVGKALVVNNTANGMVFQSLNIPTDLASLTDVVDGALTTSLADVGKTLRWGGTSWEKVKPSYNYLIDVPPLPIGSTAVAGIVEIADAAEVTALTSTTTVITPSALNQFGKDNGVINVGRKTGVVSPTDILYNLGTGFNLVDMHKISFTPLNINPTVAASVTKVIINGTTRPVYYVDKTGAQQELSSTFLRPNTVVDMTYDAAEDAMILCSPLYPYATVAQGYPGVGGTLTFAHNLRSIPSDIRVNYICNTWNNGYDVGEIISSSVSSFVSPTTTSAVVRYAAANPLLAGDYFVHETTNVLTSFDSNWNVFLVVTP